MSEIDKITTFLHETIQQYHRDNTIYNLKRIIRCILGNKDILEKYIK